MNKVVEYGQKLLEEMQLAYEELGKPVEGTDEVVSSVLALREENNKMLDAKAKMLDRMVKVNKLLDTLNGPKEPETEQPEDDKLNPNVNLRNITRGVQHMGVTVAEQDESNKMSNKAFRAISPGGIA